ncbi:RBBP9/YdeN family alpha/beta hydrolase [Herbaspirillum autotrophicum]|uniref:RBBP9/YdeN family alpha/beta hydrolase n=1 Tax=Herbaspirillum autotrophicum TaxID=180195 RepID=UPI00067B9AD4|nr:alpha/beta hydrolase [Herbaspirillum autotrophicum]
MSDTRVLILPGRGGSGPDHWQTHWEAANPDFLRVQQREWNSPDRAEWVATLHQAITADTRPVVLVAHSLSVGLIAHWAAGHAGPVIGALLVAPSDVEAPAYAPGTTGFAPMALQTLPFRSTVIASTDDPRVSLARATQFAQAWGSRLDIAGACGHLGSASLLGSWDYGFSRVQELRTAAPA